MKYKSHEKLKASETGGRSNMTISRKTLVMKKMK